MMARSCTPTLVRAYASTHQVTADNRPRNLTEALSSPRLQGSHMNRPAEGTRPLHPRRPPYAPLIGREGHTPGGVGCETLKTDHHRPDPRRNGPNPRHRAGTGRRAECHRCTRMSNPTQRGNRSATPVRPQHSTGNTTQPEAKPEQPMTNEQANEPAAPLYAVRIEGDLHPLYLGPLTFDAATELASRLAAKGMNYELAMLETEDDLPGLWR